MNPTLKPITLFVAMPYTNLGPSAKWKKPDEIEAFYRDASDLIAKELGRPVRFEIEKDRAESGLIHEAMFKAAYNSDIFIADLTGANANVFFELGVRYGIRKAVTILTSQDETIPFDVRTMRVIRYANRRDIVAQTEIVDMVRQGLASADYSDSPVLKLLKLEVVDRERWLRVADIRVQTLLTAAKGASDSQRRLDLVQQAVEDDPFSFEARLELVRVLRSRQDFGSALRAIGEALERFPNFRNLWELHKERGLVLDRMTAAGDNRLDEAIAAYRIALSLHDADADLHGCIGGVLRRQGLKLKDREKLQCLQESLDHYQRAIRLERHNTYAGLNILRLLMLMPGQVSKSPGQVQDYLKRIYHLCAFEATDATLKDEEGRWWKLFDFGDTLVFSKDPDQALDLYRRAIDLIPAEKRAETLLPPIRTWQELLESGALEDDICPGAENVIRLLEAAVPRD